MKTTNHELINKINLNIPILDDKIKDGIEEYNNYLEVLKFEEFVEDLNDTEDQSIKKAESILDRLDEMIKRNDLANTKLKEIVEGLNNIINNIENEKEKLAERNNEIIDNIIDLEERKIDKLILQNPKRKNGLKGDLEDKKEEWNEHRIFTEKIIRKKQGEEVKKRTNNTIDFEEMKQIEEWTHLKVGNIIFDSNFDNWDEDTSVFDQKIINKSNLIFLIEDGYGNKFGGYVNAKIDEYDDFINDSKSFVFSLKSNRRLNGMFKFDINYSRYAFYLCNQSDECLFVIGEGNDICICKENNKNESFCEQQSFNYNGIAHSLCGKSFPNYFRPKRITVIQLIQ